MADILESILLAAKKLPGQTVGGGVDLMNTILGGGANIVQAIQGKEITREIGEGLIPKPVGGSEQLNEFFGLPSKSSGLMEESASAVMNALSPAGAVKSAIVGGKAMIVAAGILTEPAVLARAKRAIAEGTDPAQVFKYTGVYEGPIDKKLRTVIDDSTSKFKPSATITDPIRGETVVNAGEYNHKTLDQILKHDELFYHYPELRDVSVLHDSKLPTGNASYSANEAGVTIRLGPMNSKEELQSALLHETQHAIQHLEGFASGSSYKSFLPSKNFYESFTKVQNTARELKISIAKKYGILPDDVANMANNPAMKGSGILADPDYQLYMRTRRAQEVGIEAENAAKMKYRHTAGEAEARAVQTQFESAKLRGREGELFFPLDLYDVPPSSLLLSPFDSKLLSKPVTKP